MPNFDNIWFSDILNRQSFIVIIWRSVGNWKMRKLMTHSDSIAIITSIPIAISNQALLTLPFTEWHNSAISNMTHLLWGYYTLLAIFIYLYWLCIAHLTDLALKILFCWYLKENPIFKPCWVACSDKTYPDFI